MSLEKEAYEQNYQQFRSLNQIMWQIPVLAMTLTGGLWFGVSKIENNSLLACLLLLTAIVGNLSLVVVLRRFRFVMSQYLSWLKEASPAGFVDAETVDPKENWLQKFLTKKERVRQMFSFLLCWAALVSLVLLISEGCNWYKGKVVKHIEPGISYYDEHAMALADGYEAISFEDAYPFLVPVLSNSALKVLDIGSGTGRDAAWIAMNGHSVVAVEPSNSMRAIAKKLHPNKSITWIDDQLPSLLDPAIQNKAFDVVLLNAVWMHLPPHQHESSMLRIFELTKEGGAAFVSLRLGPQDDDRGMYTVSSSDFVNLAKNVGFKVIPEGDFSDLLGRPEVSWKMYRLQK